MSLSLIVFLVWATLTAIAGLGWYAANVKLVAALLLAYVIIKLLELLGVIHAAVPLHRGEGR